MKQFLVVMNSTSINRNGTAFCVEALESGLNQCWETGLPYFIGHNHHRLIGWSAPIAIHIQPGLARTAAVVQVPENAEEEQAIKEALFTTVSRRISQVMEPVRSELEEKLRLYLVGEAEEVAPSGPAFLQNDLARRTFTSLFKFADKDGLIPLRELRVIGPGEFERDGLVFYAHPFFRRSLSRLNTLNGSFLNQLQALAKTTQLDIRIALDPNMVGLAKVHHTREELQYWWGPHFSDDIASIDLGVTRHDASQEQKYFGGISRTEFWWYDQGGARTFECEELNDIPSYGTGETEFGCRFVHGIAATDHKTIRHTDGAIRLYDEAAMLKRLEVDLKSAGRKSDYTKLWRIDGELPIATWKRLISDYFRDNTLVGEYFGGSDKTIDEFRRTSEESDDEDASVFDYVPAYMTGEEGVSISVSYHSRFSETEGGRLVKSFDTLANDSIKYRYFDSDALEIIKLIRRRGLPVKIEDELVRVRFEDDIINLPAFLHTGPNAISAAEDTIAAIVEIFSCCIGKGIAKTATIDIGVNYEDRAVFFSLVGRTPNLVQWLQMPQARLPQSTSQLGRWCENALATISKHLPSKSANDTLWQTLKESGLLKLERRILHPDEFSIQKGATKVRVNVSGRDAELLRSNHIGIARMTLIRSSTCSHCGKPYESCLHSKYLDEGVIHRITSIEPLGIYWAIGSTAGQSREEHPRQPSNALVNDPSQASRPDSANVG